MKGTTSLDFKTAEISKSPPIDIPINKSEQENIGKILSSMDEELKVLEEKFSKAKSLKQGMIQQLLTGKIRIV